MVSNEGRVGIETTNFVFQKHDFKQSTNKIIRSILYIKTKLFCPFQLTKSIHSMPWGIEIIHSSRDSIPWAAFPQISTSAKFRVYRIGEDLRMGIMD